MTIYGVTWYELGLMTKCKPSGVALALGFVFCHHAVLSVPCDILSVPCDILYIHVCHGYDRMKNTVPVILFFNGASQKAVNTRTRATFPPTCHVGRHQVKKYIYGGCWIFLLRQQIKVVPLKHFRVSTIPNTWRLR